MIARSGPTSSRRIVWAAGVAIIAATLGAAAPAQAAAPNDYASTAQVIPTLNTSIAQGVAEANVVDGDDDVNCAGTTVRNTRWYRFTGTGTPMILDTVNSDFDTVLIVYRVNADGSHSFADQPNCSDDLSGSDRARLERPFAAGTDYLVQVGACATYEDTNGQTQTCPAPSGDMWTGFVTNDDRSHAETLLPRKVSRANDGATVTPQEPQSCKGTSFTSSVWFRFDAPRDGTAVLQVANQQAVISVLPAGSGAPLDCASPGSAFDQSGSSLSVPVGRGAYDVQIGSNESGGFEISYTFVPTCKPEIPNNAVDEDCDGVSGVDADDDKHMAPPEGGDCRDDLKPVHPGARDVRGNKLDEDCVDGSAPLARLPGRLKRTSSTRGAITTITALYATRVLAGSRVELRCKRRWCGRSRRVIPVRRARRKVDVIRYLRTRRLPPGVRVELRVTRREYVGEALRFVTRVGRVPRETDLCLRPGRKPKRC